MARRGGPRPALPAVRRLQNAGHARTHEDPRRRGASTAARDAEKSAGGAGRDRAGQVVLQLPGLYTPGDRAPDKSVETRSPPNAEYNYAVQSEGCVASTAPYNEKTSSPSAVETGSCAHEPLSLDSMGPYCKTAADLGGKCCSPSSNHSSENSVPEGPRLREELSLLKCLTEDGQRPEWTFYPRPSSNIHTYHVGKQCLFNGVFLGNKRSLAERTVDKMLGRKKYDIDPRNGIPTLNPGDNPYMIPEQSKGFYKAGATLPPVNFALVPYEKKFDTFIPLEPLPQIPTLPFSEKEKANNLKNEIKEVEELEYWQPAPTLVQSIFLSGALDFPRKP
ncbi:PREDICTED: spermatogenesis-associated serine-rich protein 1 [Dipodomys ordii]|uniref:Spermatogenesis-associated serine-rich protein 1 n=1 Tax=Dipodomys ordii TaxID=10020 RepID=A0A1S3FF01_DIPOR|nr:PREDICTED: spermatogenesis-associated serine-rich protein 1 [Dipodomys ordii]